MSITLPEIQPVTLQQKVRERRLRAEFAAKARAVGLVCFNPDTDPDTCERVKGLSDEVIHAEEQERMRDFTVEHFAEITLANMHTEEMNAAYDLDECGGF